MQLPVPQRRYTVSEYLELERASEEKHEYRDGYIVPMGDNPALGMAGGTFWHGLITMNFGAELRQALMGKPCRVVDSNVRVRIARTPLFTYPDVTAVCGTLQFDPNDKQGTLLNPILIAEVLSPSTEAYDRGEKFNRYRQIDSLEEYVLISQDTTRVESFFRQPDGTWLLTVVSGLDAHVDFRSLSVSVPLAGIYAGVEFPPTPEPAPEI